MGGNWTNNGSFTPNSHTVTFDGGGTQTLDSGAITFYDLTVNSGSTLVDLAEFTVDGTLTNNGTLQKTQDVNDSLDVDFFNTGGYGGLTLNANGTNLGSTQVSIKGNQDCTTAGETVKRCFDVSPTITSTRNATITFYFDSSELSGNTCSELNIYHWDGSEWDALTLDTSYDTDGRLCGSDPQSVRVKSVSDFSSFVLKSGDDPNAVTLARFTARLAGEDLTGFQNLSGLVALAALGAVGGALLLRARRRRSRR